MSGKHKKDVGVFVRTDGVSFRVWAPFADNVAVTGAFNDWSETPMESEQDGYWSTVVANAEAGQEYKFVIRRGEATYHRNDPRALHLTTAAGNSVIAERDFDWEGDSFQAVPYEQQVLYEIHVGTFFRPDPAISGTFTDVIAKLDYLANLGINTIELMPIGAMSMDRGWGYAIDYIYAVESLYGGRRGFLEFVKAAHQRGIGVVLDVVYNHFGPDEKLDLWQFDGWNEDGKGGIYFYNDWRSETPWGNTRPDFGRTEVQQYILDNVGMWMHECHLDGLRVDSTIFIRNAKGWNDAPDTDLPDGWLLLQRINTLVRKINPAAITIAEDVGGNEYITKRISEGGAGFAAQWQLHFPQVLREALWTSDPWHINLDGICEELGKRYNDDAFQRVIFSDSHDSAANGSARLNEVIAPGKADDLFARKQSLIAATLLLTAPGIPMLFQGQEFMEGGSFNDWQALDWDKADTYKGITEAYRRLIRLRKDADGVTAGLLGQNINLFLVDKEKQVIAYHRWLDGGAKDDTVVIINFSDKQYDVYELNFPIDGTWKVRFNSSSRDYGQDLKGIGVADIVTENSRGSLVIPPSCALVLSQD